MGETEVNNPGHQQEYEEDVVSMDRHHEEEWAEDLPQDCVELSSLPPEDGEWIEKLVDSEEDDKYKIEEGDDYTIHPRSPVLEAEEDNRHCLLNNENKSDAESPTDFIKDPIRKKLHSLYNTFLPQRFEDCNNEKKRYDDDISDTNSSDIGSYVVLDKVYSSFAQLWVRIYGGTTFSTISSFAEDHHICYALQEIVQHMRGQTNFNQVNKAQTLGEQKDVYDLFLQNYNCSADCHYQKQNAKNVDVSCSQIGTWPLENWICRHSECVSIIEGTSQA